jgi:hypothetical protein
MTLRSAATTLHRATWGESRLGLAQYRIKFDAATYEERGDEQARKNASGGFCQGAQTFRGGKQQLICSDGHQGEN